MEKKRFIISVLVILVAIGLIILPLILFRGTIVNNLDSSVEIASYVSQIVSSFFVITGVVIAGWQYYLTSKVEIEQIKIEQVQKAIDLAEYYKDNILGKYAPIFYVYKRSGIVELLRAADSDMFKDFDKLEASRIFKLGKFDELKALQSSKIFVMSVIEANDVYGLGLEKGAFVCGEDRQKHDREGISELASCFMREYVTTILNNLEFFALHFMHGVADESVIYQSLYQSYLQIVQTLYFNIANFNDLRKVKYYTNVIELYGMWNDRTNERISRIEDESRRVSVKGTVIKI